MAEPIRRFDRFVLLGAGASYGARLGLRPWDGGCETTFLPPLGESLGIYLEQWYCNNVLVAREPLSSPTICGKNGCSRFPPDETGLGALAQGSEHIAAASRFLEATNTLEAFEAGMGNLAPRVAAHGHRLTAAAMTHDCVRCNPAFCAGADRYDDLVQLWGGPTTTCWITLNYDILLEEAIGRSFANGGDLSRIVHPEMFEASGDSVSDATRIAVYKPHGSAHWFARGAYAVGHDLGAVTRIAQQHPTVLCEDGAGSFTRQLPHCWSSPNRSDAFGVLMSGDGESVIARYAEQKPAEVNPRSIASHRRHCIYALKANPCAPVFVIGVRIPKSDTDDPFLKQMLDVLQTTRPKRFYISPSTNDCDTAQQHGFIPVLIDLAKFIDLTRELRRGDRPRGAFAVVG